MARLLGFHAKVPCWILGLETLIRSSQIIIFISICCALYLLQLCYRTRSPSRRTNLSFSAQRLLHWIICVVFVVSFLFHIHESHCTIPIFPAHQANGGVMLENFLPLVTQQLTLKHKDSLHWRTLGFWAVERPHWSYFFSNDLISFFECKSYKIIYDNTIHLTRG